MAGVPGDDLGRPPRRSSSCMRGVCWRRSTRRRRARCRARSASAPSPRWRSPRSSCRGSASRPSAERPLGYALDPTNLWSGAWPSCSRARSRSSPRAFPPARASRRSRKASPRGRSSAARRRRSRRRVGAQRVRSRGLRLAGRRLLEGAQARLAGLETPLASWSTSGVVLVALALRDGDRDRAVGGAEARAVLGGRRAPVRHGHPSSGRGSFRSIVTPTPLPFERCALPRCPGP